MQWMAASNPDRRNAIQVLHVVWIQNMLDVPNRHVVLVNLEKMDIGVCVCACVRVYTCIGMCVCSAFNISLLGVMSSK